MTKIMVVDDAAFMRMKCTRLLSENGYEVTEASTGLEAVQKYNANRPDAVLLDITMPVMDGMEALRLIRQRDSDAKVVMVTAVADQVMVTAVADQRIVMEALRGGASDFIPKPLTPEKITRAVETLNA